MVATVRVVSVCPKPSISLMPVNFLVSNTAGSSLLRRLSGNQYDLDGETNDDLSRKPSCSKPISRTVERSRRRLRISFRHDWILSQWICSFFDPASRQFQFIMQLSLQYHQRKGCEYVDENLRQSRLLHPQGCSAKGDSRMSWSTSNPRSGGLRHSQTLRGGGRGSGQVHPTSKRLWTRDQVLGGFKDWNWPSTTPTWMRTIRTMKGGSVSAKCSDCEPCF